MNNQITKQDIELLLPFYINGTLDEQETQLVEQAIAEDENLQQELTFLRALQSHVKQQKQDESVGELGLKRLQKKLKEQHAEDQATQMQQKLSGSKKRWQLASIAACLMLLVQTVNNFESDSDVYQAAGGNVIVQHQGAIVSVAFVAETSEQNIRSLLLKMNVVIVDGPSALGIYRLSVPDNIESTINRLKLRTDVIESIQQE